MGLFRGQGSGSRSHLDLAHALPGPRELKSPDGKLHLAVLVLATDDLPPHRRLT